MRKDKACGTGQTVRRARGRKVVEQRTVKRLAGLQLHVVHAELAACLADPGRVLTETVAVQLLCAVAVNDNALIRLQILQFDHVGKIKLHLLRIQHMKNQHLVSQKAKVL